MIKEDSGKRVFLITLVAQGLIALQGFLSVPIIVKSAGGANYATYVLLTNMISISFGLLTSTQYLYRRKLVSAKSIPKIRDLMDHQISVHLVGLLAMGVVLVWIGTDIQALVLGRDGVVVSRWILVAVLGAMFIGRQVQDYYRFTLRFRIFNITSVSSLYLFLTLSAVWALIGNVLSVDVLFLLQFIASLVVHLPFLALMLGELGVPRLHLRIREVSSDIHSNLPFVLEFIIDFVLAFSDRYLISLFLSVASVATYQPAYQLASLVLFFPRLAATVLVPSVSKMVDSGDRVTAEDHLQTFMKFFLMVALPFAIGVLMLGTPVMSLLTTPEIAAGGRWVPPLIALGSICYGIVLLMDPVALALGRNRLVATGYAAGAGVNLALNLILLPLFRDVHVAAMTTLAGYTVSCLWIWSILRTQWRLRVNGVDLLRYSAASTVMALVLFVMGIDYTGGFSKDILPIVSRIAIGVVVYFAALSAVGGFGRTELKEINSLFDFPLRA